MNVTEIFPTDSCIVLSKKNTLLEGWAVCEHSQIYQPCSAHPLNSLAGAVMAGVDIISQWERTERERKREEKQEYVDS